MDSSPTSRRRKTATTTNILEHYNSLWGLKRCMTWVDQRIDIENETQIPCSFSLSMHADDTAWHFIRHSSFFMVCFLCIRTSYCDRMDYQFSSTSFHIFGYFVHVIINRFYLYILQNRPIFQK